MSTSVLLLPNGQLWEALSSTDLPQRDLSLSDRSATVSIVQRIGDSSRLSRASPYKREKPIKTLSGLASSSSGLSAPMMINAVCDFCRTRYQFASTIW